MITILTFSKKPKFMFSKQTIITLFGAVFTLFFSSLSMAQDCPELVLSIVASSCTVDDGKIIIDNPTEASLYDTQLSIDGGITYNNIYFEDAGIINYEGLAEGTYEVWIRNSASCEKFLQNIEISCGAIASVCDLRTSLGDNQVICINQGVDKEITLSAKTSTSYDLNGQVWSNGETTKSITVAPKSSGFYSVTVYDSNGCEGSDEIFVEVCNIPAISWVDNCSEKRSQIGFISQNRDVSIKFLEFSFDDGLRWQLGKADDAGNVFFSDIPDGDYTVLARCSSDSCPTVVGSFSVSCKNAINEGMDCYPLFKETVEYSSQFWYLGGSDAALAQDEAFTGSNSFRIRDNSGKASSIFSTNFPVNYASKIEVDFAFKGVSMEFKESFSLEVSVNGGEYNKVKTWTSMKDFKNDQWNAVIESIELPIGASFASVRFICDATSNMDMVFIDDILIGLCFEPNSGGGVPFVKADDLNVLDLDTEEIDHDQSEIGITVFPNPSTDYIGFLAQNIDQQVEGHTVNIYDTDGKRLINQYLASDDDRIDINSLPKERMYMILITNSNKDFHKVLKFYKN